MSLEKESEEKRKRASLLIFQRVSLQPHRDQSHLRLLQPQPEGHSHWNLPLGRLLRLRAQLRRRSLRHRGQPLRPGLEDVLPIGRIARFALMT